MKQPLSGIRVVEVGTFLFVPSAAALLGDWGASVVKVEHPDWGDPLRGIRTPADSAGSATMPPVVQLANRGKRSIALGLERKGARPVLERLIADCDVFITNLLPAARTRLGIEVDDLRQMNPIGHLRCRQRGRKLGPGPAARRLRALDVLGTGRTGRHISPACALPPAANAGRHG